MSETVRNPDATVTAEAQDADNLTTEEAIAKRAQFGQTGDAIDPGLGNMGGAGASGGIEPDIARQSTPGA